MSRRTRARQRQRRFAPAAAPSAAAPAERAVQRESIRPRLGRAAPGRATGQPSAGLLRAATAEYGYVLKDLRRIAVVAGVMLVLLAFASVAANIILK